MIADAGGLVVLNLLFVAAGAGVTGLAGWWRGGRGLVGSLGLAYLAGAAAFGVVAQLLYVLGASLSLAEVCGVCAVLSLGAARALRSQGVRSFRPDPMWVLVPVALFLLLLAVDLWYQPLWGYDSWTFWTPRAHGLYALGGLDTSWFTSATMLGGARRDYPILLPAIEAAGFRFTGYETTLLDLQSWLFLLAFVVMVYQASVARARQVVLAAVLLMVVVAPSTVAQLAAAEADIPLATFVGAAGICGFRWLETGRRSMLALAAVLAAAAAATKIEGAIFVGALFVALAICNWRRSRRDSAAAIAALVMVIAAGLLPWRIWVAVHGGAPAGEAPSLAPSTLLSHLSYIPYAAGYLLFKLLDPRGWLLIAPLWAVATWAAWRAARRRAVVFAVGTVVLAFCGLVISYWSTPLDLHFHLATSARRVVTSLIFFCAALTPLLAARSDDDRID
jgi:4-amino-4-deoxy-L-arabinose transferase-like glycosyltransferase